MVNENPRSPPDIWFAIGLCYFKMNNLVKVSKSVKSCSWTRNRPYTSKSSSVRRK